MSQKILAALLLFTTLPSLASIICRNATAAIAGLTGGGTVAPERVTDLSPVHSHSLPENFLAAVRAHPVAKVFPKNGEGVCFQIDNYGELHAERLGESIQAELIAKTLKAAYPEATYIDETASPPRGMKLVRIRVADPSEIAKGRPKIDPDLMPMPILKAANPTAASLDKIAVRKVLGVNPEDRVVSLYIRDGAEAKKIIDAVKQQLNPRLILLSFNTIKVSPNNPHWAKDFVAKTKGILGTDYEYGFLSEHRAEELGGYGSPAVLANDTVGYLPHLHAAADVTVVSGPINVFEPLTVGTPTLIFKSPENAKGYVASTYKQMIATAEATGMAKLVTKPSEFGKAAMALWTTPTGNRTAPYLTPVDNRTPTDTYLDRLNQVISR